MQQLVMPFASSTSYHAVDFVRGSANEAAFALVEQWPHWPYSIMLLHGAAHSGKTHLAHVFAAHSHATFLAPARIGTRPADQLLVGNHAWVVDGIETITDAAALAQLINHARARGDYLLLTATHAAAHLPFTLPDLRSRLLALPAIALGDPDDALLIAVLSKLFADRQIRIAPEILQFAAHHIERSFPAAYAFVARLDALSLAHGRAITLSLVRKLVFDGLPTV